MPRVTDTEATDKGSLGRTAAPAQGRWPGAYTVCRWLRRTGAGSQIPPGPHQGVLQTRDRPATARRTVRYLPSYPLLRPDLSVLRLQYLRP